MIAIMTTNVSRKQYDKCSFLVFAHPKMFCCVCLGYNSANSLIPFPNGAADYLGCGIFPHQRQSGEPSLETVFCKLCSVVAT